MAGPRTTPFVPGVHASTLAMIGNGCGDTARTCTTSLVQPVPNGPQLSRHDLVIPHELRRVWTQSAAALSAGELVRRPPYTSVSHDAVSMTCDRSSPSARILANADESGVWPIACCAAAKDTRSAYRAGPQGRRCIRLILERRGKVLVTPSRMST